MRKLFTMRMLLPGTMRLRSPLAIASFVAVAILLPVTSVSAQLANASASSLGLSGNDTATVRGFGAISVNPAGLAMPGSDFSLTIAPARVSGGIGPITLGEMKAFEGKLLDDTTKRNWMERIESADGQRISAGVEVSEIAVTYWNVGLQLSSVAAASAHVPSEAIEIALFGNAGRTGEPKDVSLSAQADGYATTTAGLSIATPIPIDQFDHLALGATVKYSIGHAVAIGRASSSIPAYKPAASFDGVLIHTPVTEGASYFDSGSGLGLDLGVMLESDRLTVGASVQNVVNTFAWDESRLMIRQVTGSFDAGSVDLGSLRDLESLEELIDADFNEGEWRFPEAPADVQARMRALLADATFKPSVRVGGAYRIRDDLTVSGDLHYRFGAGIAFVPQFHVGVGAEYQALEYLQLRGGLAVITGGVQLGGGASVILGPVNLSLAVAGKTDGVLSGQFGVSFGNR